MNTSPGPIETIRNERPRRDERSRLGAAARIVLLGIVLLAGCRGPELATTPNLFLGSPEDPFVDVPPALRSNEVRMYYLTDREPIETTDGEVRYGFGRSPSLALGTCVVTIGDDVPWETRVAESRSRRRATRLPVRPLGGQFWGLDRTYPQFEE